MRDKRGIGGLILAKEIGYLIAIITDLSDLKVHKQVAALVDKRMIRIKVDGQDSTACRCR